MIKNFRVGKAHLIKNAYIIETGNLYGNMSKHPKFYPEYYSEDDCKRECLKHRILAGDDLGFDGRRMFMPKQSDLTGTYLEVTNDLVLSNDDCFHIEIPEDILIMNNDVEDVIIGHSVGDCSVVMCYDRRQDVVAASHCGAREVDLKMPIFVVDSLKKTYNSRDEDILTYVSACAGNSWQYDRYPVWAKDLKFWDKFIKEKNSVYKIDLKSAILSQLHSRNIKDIIVSPVDTIIDDDFYSNSATYAGNTHKDGRHYAGVYFKRKK